MEGEHRIRRGSLLSYRLFDAASSLDLEAAERLLGGGAALDRGRLVRPGSEALVIATAPLDIGLGRREITLERGGSVVAELRARLFDFGTVSLRYEIAVEPGTPLERLLPVLDDLYDSAAVEGAARAELSALLGRLGPALEAGEPWAGVETYTIAFVQEFEGRPRAAAVLESAGLDRLLLGESARNLAPGQREDVLHHSLSYLDDDLVVIDWNGAFVLEPSGSRDVADVLEFATAQLLEMRYYDALLDRELGRIYDEIRSAPRRPPALLWSPYGRLARKVLQRWLELTEFTERADNALTVVGDFYLARVYHAAVKRFRISAWHDAVERKQQILARVYGFLQGEVAARRSLLLEAAIVLLILYEILVSLGRG